MLDIGTVFIANGVGAVIGSLLGAPFYRRLQKEMTLGLSSLVIGALCFALPNTDSVAVLHILYFIGGLAAGLIDTGVSILVNALAGDAAGAWQIAIQLAFNGGGAFSVFFKQIFSLTIYSLFYGIGVLNMLVALFIMIIPIRNYYHSKYYRVEEVVEEESLSSSAKVSIIRPQINFSSKSSRKNDRGITLNSDSLVVMNDIDSRYCKEKEEIIAETELNTPKTEEIELTSMKEGPNTILNTDLETGNEEKEQQMNTNTTNTYATTKNESTKNTAINTTASTTVTPTEPENYYADICIAFLILFIIGSGTSTTAYLQTYAEDTDIVSTNTSNFQLYMLLFTMTIGILFSLFLRNYLFTENEHLPWIFTIFALLSTIGALLLLVIPDRDASVLWSGLIIYGFFSKPCVGFAFQWLTMITSANETSFAIAYVGLNAGSGIVPYITTALWSNGIGPDALFIVLVACMLLSIPLLFMSQRLSCKKE